MISIIIPSYNRAGTIKRSVDSVLSQECGDIEVIVVDDCSSDDTKETVRAIKDERVRLVCLEKNSGACVARNTGIKEAKGGIIAFQDSDDVWLPGKLKKQADVIKEKGADICFCSVKRHYTGQNAKTMIFPVTKHEEGFLTHADLCRQSLASTQTIVAKREVFEEHVFDPVVKKSQDYDWMIRASRNNKVYFIKEPLVEQFLQDDSITLSGAARIAEVMAYFLEKYKDECDNDKQFKLSLLKKAAHYKTVSGQNAAKEYSEILKLEKTMHNRLCVGLSKLGMAKLLIRK